MGYLILLVLFFLATNSYIASKSLSIIIQVATFANAYLCVSYPYPHPRSTTVPPFTRVAPNICLFIKFICFVIASYSLGRLC